MIPVDLPFRESLSSDVCVIQAAQANAIAPDLLFAVRAVERGLPGKSVSNSNGSRDFNEAGLNDRTIEELVEKHGWDRVRLVSDGCYGMYAAAFWMRLKMDAVRHRNLPLLAKAARYNSATPSLNIKYQHMLLPYMANWACYLHVYWRMNPESMFIVASGALRADDFVYCKR